MSRRNAPKPERCLLARGRKSRLVTFLAITLSLVLIATGSYLFFKQSSLRPTSPLANTEAPLSMPSVPAPVPAPTPAASVFGGSYSELITNFKAATGVALRGVGSSEPAIVLGEFTVGPAWSTMKVPLAIAALRNSDPAVVTTAMQAAIMQSDNDAADSLWRGLGDPQTAALRVEEILRTAGDEDTVVQSQRIRPEFSAFGQTMWTLERQTQFLAATACDPLDRPVLELMGNVEAEQRWGLGQLGDARFKGGWGPSPSGKYTVRQMGLLSTSHGLTAVALAAAPESGSFDDGTKILTALADWLAQRLDAMPAGHCP